MATDYASASQLATYFDGMDAEETIPLVFPDLRRIFPLCPLCAARLLRKGLVAPGLAAEDLSRALSLTDAEAEDEAAYGMASVWANAGVTMDDVEACLAEGPGHLAPWKQYEAPKAH